MHQVCSSKAFFKELTAQFETFISVHILNTIFPYFLLLSLAFDSCSRENAVRTFSTAL